MATRPSQRDPAIANPHCASDGARARPATRAHTHYVAISSASTKVIRTRTTPAPNSSSRLYRMQSGVAAGAVDRDPSRVRALAQRINQSRPRQRVLQTTTPGVPQASGQGRVGGVVRWNEFGGTSVSEARSGLRLSAPTPAARSTRAVDELDPVRSGAAGRRVRVVRTCGCMFGPLGRRSVVIVAKHQSA